MSTHAGVEIQLNVKNKMNTLHILNREVLESKLILIDSLSI